MSDAPPNTPTYVVLQSKLCMSVSTLLHRCSTRTYSVTQWHTQAAGGKGKVGIVHYVVRVCVCVCARVCVHNHGMLVLSQAAMDAMLVIASITTMKEAETHIPGPLHK